MTERLLLASLDRADGGPLAAVRGCTWYFRLLLKGAIAGVIVGVRSLSERSDPPVGQWQAAGVSLQKGRDHSYVTRWLKRKLLRPT